MKRSFFFVAAALVALLPANADAQLYNGDPSGFSQFDFENAKGPDGTATAGTFGVYVGPYTGNFLDDAAGSFSIYCVDYLHYASDMNNVDVNVSGLSGSLANTRLNDPVRYQKAAYLSSLFDSWGTWGTDKRTVFSGIHAAIWSVTSGSTLGSGMTAGLREDFLTMANDNYDTVNLDEWYVITRDASDLDGYMESGDGMGQEFLMRRSVPEPGTLLLMLTGMVMLVGVSRKRAFDLGSL